MLKYLVTMGGIEKGKNRHNNEGVHRDYTAEANRLVNSAKTFFDNFVIGTNEIIEAEKGFDVLKEPSFGWAFKPFMIFKTLQKMEDGDLLMWTDSNHIIQKDPKPFFDFALKNKGVFTWDHWANSYRLSEYTHMDTFVNMGCASQKYYNAPVLQVNTMVFLKNSYTFPLVAQWLNYCLDYDVIIRNNLSNLPDYIDHRHEQSVWSILVKHYKIPYFHRKDFDFEFIVTEGEVINV